MKKKVFVIIAAGALIITTFGTGYAYYESQVTSTVDYVSNQEPKATKSIPEAVTVDEISEINNLIQNEASDVSAEDNSDEEEFFGGCCGSGAYSMLDENGNFKTPEVYEQELDEGIKNGELTVEDKEYLLDVYNECYEFYYNNSQELKGNEF